jgi:hypothetical protein
MTTASVSLQDNSGREVIDLPLDRGLVALR